MVLEPSTASSINSLLQKLQPNMIMSTSPKSPFSKIGLCSRQKPLRVMVLGQGGVGKSVRQYYECESDKRASPVRPVESQTPVRSATPCSKSERCLRAWPCQKLFCKR
ncbi:unnamed protein product [Timema podura]|uniref:Uncharacterized protein n=1 Tax=Timema podura TaxID=61482 RepID=A0ABN7P348_TIMPD|nr:unnamed protein product [Timema podura]